MSVLLKLIACLLVSILYHLPSDLTAQQRGRVQSRPCPFSCKTQGLPKNVCRDWRQGNTCYVEDLSRGPGQQQRPPQQRRGHVSSRQCPHSCKTVGLPKSSCRDWKEGNICYVEDLTRAPGRDPVVVQPQGPVYEPVQPSGTDARSACAQMGRWDMGRPRIDIGRSSHTGNIFGDRRKVRGTVEGRCLVEAAVFEDGRKVQDIRVDTTPEFRRFDFEVKVRGGRDPQIRVYNSAGDRDTAYLDDSDRTDSQESDSPWDIFGR